MSFSVSNGGLNVANSTEGFSPSNCVPLSTGLNVWNLGLFFGANILAHAATIHPRTGATKSNTFRRMMLMLVAPITAGTVATHAIVTFVLGIKSHGWKWAHFLGGAEKLQDAVPAGAVAILVPKDLAPVVAGRWKLVGSERHSLYLNNERTDNPREPYVPADDTYLEFILPPQSRLPGYTKHKFYPSSSFANELIAVIQLIYGVYQLVSQYGPEIQIMGLSSPYICAIPYLFMSLINLLANILMESYSHIIVLPPQIQRSPQDQKDCTTVIRRRRKQLGKVFFCDEFEWNQQYVHIDRHMLHRGRVPDVDGYTKRERKQLAWQPNPFLSFITWSFHGYFLKFSSSWSIESHPSKDMERQLEKWLEIQYPGVETCIHDRPLRIYHWSRYISVFATLVFTTALLGALTRFQFMVGVDAGRFIAWIYIPPTVLILPFIMMEYKGTSVYFWLHVDVLSQYARWKLFDVRWLHGIIFSAYVGALVQIGLALWSIGDCTIFSQADHQTWIS